MRRQVVIQHHGAMNDTHDAAQGERSSRDRHWMDLQRSHDAVVGGVGRGIARHLGIDPLLVRVAFVATALIGGSGLIAYLGLWLLLPSDDGRPSLVARWLSLRDNEPTARRIGLIGVGLLTVLAFVGGISAPWHTFGWIVWLALPAVGIWWLVVALQGDSSSTADRPPIPEPTAVPPTDRSETPTVPQPAQATAYDSGGSGDTVALDPDQTEPCEPPTPGDPRLTLITLSLAAITCGALGIWQLTGASIEPATYAAATLGIIGLGLLLGSVVGDGRGLIGWGHLAAFALLVTAAMPWNGMGQVHERPGTTGELQSSYSLSMGEIELDLTELDPHDVAGRTIELDVRMGNVTVLLPADTDVRFEGSVWAGMITAFDRQNSGVAVDMSYNDRSIPALRLEVNVGFGNIEVRNP